MIYPSEILIDLKAFNKGLGLKPRDNFALGFLTNGTLANPIAMVKADGMPFTFQDRYGNLHVAKFDYATCEMVFEDGSRFPVGFNTLTERVMFQRSGGRCCPKRNARQRCTIDCCQHLLIEDLKNQDFWIVCDVRSKRKEGMLPFVYYPIHSHILLVFAEDRSLTTNGWSREEFFDVVEDVLSASKE